MEKIAARRSRRSAGHRYIRVHLSLVVMLALVFTSSAWAATTTSETFTVTPAAIPFSEPEIVNPQRGFYRWYGREPIPQPRPSYEHYIRYGWRALEPSKGQYDFSMIEHDLLMARHMNASFAFRVMAVNGFSSPMEVPEYLRQEIGGAYCSYNGQTVWVPNWNHPLFVERARALMQALGARFNGERWLAYYDLGLYGHWGEWHTGGLCTPPGSTATKRALVDMQLAAFPDSPVLMNAGADSETFAYALNRSPEIGVRVDSLCSVWFDEQFNTDPTKKALMQTRWKTAPIVSEYVGGGHPDLPQCDRQVREWHVASVASGNFGDWQSYSAAEQAQLLMLGKHSGYRFQLNTLTYPVEVTAGARFAIDSGWSNAGVTPLYKQAAVLFQLQRQSDSTVVWRGSSRLDLERLLPTAQPQPLHDELMIPRWLPPGRYDLSLIVREPTGTGTTITLASTGAAAGGHYPLGSILVQAGAPGYDVYLPHMTR
ncbi:MAG TPA: DUF4832 domain-containing protein [Herpetosiphonaceae bacterium]